MSKVPKWHVKAVYMVFALALVVSLSGAFAVAVAPMSTSAAEPNETNTLRIYGKCEENAAFPYTDYRGPFVLDNHELADPTLNQTPAKDFIQWNPAYLDHGDYGMIKADSTNAGEKVHLRQWYVPKYCEPSGIVWADQAAVKSPDLVKEYTYVLVDSDTQDPISGSPGMTTKLMLPIGDTNNEQVGLDDFDVDGDGIDDVAWIEAIGTVGDAQGQWPKVADTLGFSPCVPGLVTAENNIAAGTKWVDINTQQLSVGLGDTVRFLDHAAEITAITTTPASVTVTLWYTGNAEDNTKSENMIVRIGETLSAGRHQITYAIEDLTVAPPSSPPNAPSESGQFIAGDSNLRLVKAPWYLQVSNVAGGIAPTASVVVGRLLVQGESFFVDGAEYEVAMIHTVEGGMNKIEDEYLGEGAPAKVDFGPIGVENPDWADPTNKFFADCDGDGDVDKDDVDVYVDGISVASTAYDIHKDTGGITFNVAPGILDVVTIDYCYDSLAFKYITLRNGLPKYDDVDLTALSVVKESIGDCDTTPAIPILPPFNRVHDIIDDTNIPDAFGFMYKDLNDEYQDCPMPDVQLPDNLADTGVGSDLDSPYDVANPAPWGTFMDGVDTPLGTGHDGDRATADDTLVMLTCNGLDSVFTWLYTPDGYGDQTFLPYSLNSIKDRWITDVEAVAECFKQEDKEPRFDTNLLEEKFCEDCECIPEYDTDPLELWRWKNIETLPYLYTEMVLPEQPDITSDVDLSGLVPPLAATFSTFSDAIEDNEGDYILVSSWITEDTACVYNGTDCVLKPIRMKFAYDAHVDKINSADIYVNDESYNRLYNDEDSDSQTVIDEASLRVYGKCNLSAAFPYDTYQGALSPQSSEAPEKDFIVWNPAYLDHYDTASGQIYEDFFEEIVVNGIDANEKVHLRQWYVPKYTEPSGMVWMTPTCVITPDIVKEYTYILLDDHNDPVAGHAGETSFVFPIVDGSGEQIGLDDYDVDLDGDADIVFLETISAVDPTDVPNSDALWPPYDETHAYDCQPDGVLTDAEHHILGLTPWIDISTRSLNVGVGTTLSLLDHSAQIVSITPSQVVVDVFYEGNTGTHVPDKIGFSDSVALGETLSAGRSSTYGPELLTPSGPPSQSATFKAGGSDLELVKTPWYLQVQSIAGDRANVVVGRLLTEGESFFVDGAEYEVAKLDVHNPDRFTPVFQAGDTEGTEYGLKYITLRNSLPKVEAGPGGADDVNLGQMSIWKNRIAPCYEWPCDGACIPMLPPFNMQHDMIDDINIPDGFSFTDMCDTHYPQPYPMPDVQLPDNEWYCDAFSDMDSPYGLAVEGGVDTLEGIGFLNSDRALADDTLMLVCVSGTQKFYWLDQPDGFGDISFLPFNLNTIDERKIEDVDATKECWKDEAKETRFDTNLLEEKFTENDSDIDDYIWNWVEKWEWKNIETLPWDYTEFVLPALPDITDLAAGVSADDGDYILVSSFMTEDSVISCPPPTSPCTTTYSPKIRVKFYHDSAFSPEYKTGLYVNTRGVSCWMEGDVNHDDDVNSADLQLIAQHIVGTITLTGDPFQAADVNDDTLVNSADLQLMAQYLVGTIPSFPGGLCIP